MRVTRVLCATGQGKLRHAVLRAPCEPEPGHSVVLSTFSKYARLFRSARGKHRVMYSWPCDTHGRLSAEESGRYRSSGWTRCGVNPPSRDASSRTLAATRAIPDSESCWSTTIRWCFLIMIPVQNEQVGWSEMRERVCEF
jgi:hypothetical protein